MWKLLVRSFRTFKNFQAVVLVDGLCAMAALREVRLCKMRELFVKSSQPRKNFFGEVLGCGLCAMAALCEVRL